MIDSNGYLHNDLSRILQPRQFDVRCVTSGRQALEALLDGGAFPTAPAFDVVIVPHEADASDGAGICHALRRLFGKRTLIVLAFLPPYLDEQTVLGYLAADVDEICIYPLSRIAMQNHFRMLADLVAERRRTRILGEFQAAAGSYGSVAAAAAAAAALLANDIHVSQAVPVHDDHPDMLTFAATTIPPEGQPYRLAGMRLAVAVAGGAGIQMLVDYTVPPQQADIDFAVALVGAIATDQTRPLEIDTMRGLLAIQDGRNEISVIKGANQYSEIVFSSGASQLLLKTPLKTIAGQFSADFVQCHRSYLVAERCAWAASHGRNGRFTLRHHQHTIPVGDNYLSMVRAYHPHWFH
ncbi:LytTR family DNA-binding domain-containing protein [Pseudokordiimonas caeni]|uniref:LytTR family DNA-binding domain-containing protein n=1 Tax=Pseudokordiimonas caeni TaxID=2997908 RepID=UPI00281128F6|nr:LytTR family DNA-binding domain-containing protein [Pseudokordiimonas caeni]